MKAKKAKKIQRLRGRDFTTAELKLIQKTVKQNFKFGRWRISLAVCEKLNWFQENGWPKDRACRDVLNSLHKSGSIKLPASGEVTIPPGKRDLVKKYYNKKRRFMYPDIIRGNLRAVLSKSDSNEKLWNKIVQEHHYLGHKVQVGKTLKFLLFKKEQMIGAFSLSEASYIPRGSSTEEQRSQTVFCAKTLRAAGLLPVAFVGSVLTARCGDARTSPPRP